MSWGTFGETMNMLQAGALLATSLQQALQRSVTEAAPVLKDVWGSRSKLSENAASLAESWAPLVGVKSRLEERMSALQKRKSDAARNSDAAEKKKSEEALKLLHSQVMIYLKHHVRLLIYSVIFHLNISTVVD